MSTSRIFETGYRGRRLRFVSHAGAVHVSRQDLLDILVLDTPQGLRDALLPHAGRGPCTDSLAGKTIGATLGPCEIGPVIHARLGLALIHRFAALAADGTGHPASVGRAEHLLDWYAEAVFAACDALRLDPRTVQAFLWHAPVSGRPLCRVRLTETPHHCSAECQELGLALDAPTLAALLDRVLDAVPAAVERHKPGLCVDDVRLVFSLQQEFAT